MTVEQPASIVGDAAGCTMLERYDPVPGLIAGFIVWLSTQRYEQDQPRRCAVAAEQFLRWQTRRRLPCDLNAYCREPAIGGLCGGKLNDVRRMIAEFDRYCRDGRRTST